MGYLYIFYCCSGICSNDLLGGGVMVIATIVASFGVGLFIGLLSWGLSRTGSMYSRMTR